MKRTLTILAIIATLSLLSACNFDPHYYEDKISVAMTIVPDWSIDEIHQPEQPTGVTSYSFCREDGEVIRTSSNKVDTFTTHLNPGTYDLVVINQSYDEFGTVEFLDQKSYKDVRVKLIVIDSKTKWYASKAEITTVSNFPEWMVCSRVEDLEFVKGHTVYRKREEDTKKTVIDTLIDTPMAPMKPMTFQVQMNVHIKGFQNLYSARAVTSGWASERLLSTNLTNDKNTAFALEKWSATKQTDTTGIISITFRTLGLPSTFTGNRDDNVLELSCLLGDLKTVADFDLPFGDLIEIKQSEKIEVVIDIWKTRDGKDIILPDVDLPEGGGGFHAYVEEWMEEIEQTITF